MADIVPEHTTNALSGHHENDLIIIYSKYEDLAWDPAEQEPDKMGLYIPQWFTIDCVRDTRGISCSSGIPTLCLSYRQMEEMGRKTVERMPIKAFKIRKVLFYYTKETISINGQDPF